MILVPQASLPKPSISVAIFGSALTSPLGSAFGSLANTTKREGLSLRSAEFYCVSDGLTLFEKRVCLLKVGSHLRGWDLDSGLEDWEVDFRVHTAACLVDNRDQLEVLLGTSPSHWSNSYLPQGYFSSESIPSR